MSRQFNNITDRESYPKKKVFNVSNPVPTFKVDLAWVHCYNCKELGHYSQNCPKPSNRFQRGGSIRLVQTVNILMKLSSRMSQTKRKIWKTSV